ncbi:MAG: FAD-binding oxidoreductase [Gammaproteobacteria bacterium]|nr:FAD-binding oxidoreductase [Gammaproteobacteria bacterium]
MPDPILDTLIVGQGLAGSALAWHLVEAGQRVQVVDDGHRTSSSKVAAGLVNPLAGMRFNRRPEVFDWLAYAEGWYDAIGDRLGRRFFFPTPMLRLFRSTAQQRFLDRALTDPDNRTLLDTRQPTQADFDGLAAPFGGFLQHRTGYVDMPGLLASIREWLQSTNRLQQRESAVDTLQVHADHVVLDGTAARQVVFCEGARLQRNPRFADLPLCPEKGEILELQVPGGDSGRIVNGQYWLVPRAGGGFRFGATHEHQRIDTQTTPAGHEELTRGLRDMLPGAEDIRVENHLAGIRPGTSDRYPLIGRHPLDPRVVVFNGFGARGALSIPWYAKQLTGHLVDGGALPPEADIARFR